MKYKAFSSPGFLYESFSVLIFSFQFAVFLILGIIYSQNENSIPFFSF